MPRNSDFEKIFQAFVKRYGLQDGEELYYAWLSKMGLDDTKPYRRPQESLGQERFDWAQNLLSYLREDEAKKYFKVEAAFPLSSMNDVVYTRDELLRAARSLVGKTVNLNHTSHVLDSVRIEGADYEDDAVECVLSVLKGSDTLGLVERGEIVHVSIEASCLQGMELTPDGAACKGLVFTGLALLTKDVLPGIPLTRIVPVEKIVESFTVPNIQEKEMSEKPKIEEGKPTESVPPTAAASPATVEAVQEQKPDVAKEIADLRAQVQSLQSEVTKLSEKKAEPPPAAEPPKGPCKPCVLTKEGFWARFHELRGEGLSKSDAFRLVSFEVIETASKTCKP
ncbi:hypothetical protein MUP01_04770 [Candidatus Bathyarchaeota archaeon]|nr:hypothetical protein [Candidatus Bathyarchaeota archaeon]